MAIRFDLAQRSYLAYVTCRDAPNLADTGITAALYAPGLPCADVADHRDDAATLSVGYLACTSRGWGFLGRQCYQLRFPQADPYPWRTALQRRYLLIGTDLASNWPEGTRRRYRRLVHPLGLILQLEPQHGWLRGTLAQMTTGKYTLSVPQKQTILKILRERGLGAYEGLTWDAELSAHRRVLQRRRDLAFRLARLAALELKEADRVTVAELQARNVAWEQGRMGGLSEGQAGLVRALEARYLAERLESAACLAERLAKRLDLT